MQAISSLTVKWKLRFNSKRMVKTFSMLQIYSSKRVASFATTILFAALLALCVASPAYAQSPDSNQVIVGLENLALGMVNLFIAISALLMAIGIATGFIGGMVDSILGRPGNLSTAWARVAGVIVCFVGAALTIAIANFIFAQFPASQPINVPGGTGMAEVSLMVSRIVSMATAFCGFIVVLSIPIGFLETQAGYAFGSPARLAGVWNKIGVAMACLIVAIMAGPISSWIASFFV